MSGPGNPSQSVDLEEAGTDIHNDHAVPEEKPSPTSAPSEASQEGTMAPEEKDRARKLVDDEDDPFAFFPRLSITMSSTRGPFSRRNTVTTLGRRLTRQETTQTLKSVRSRFTEVRSEFDENVSLT
jgi:hypothetical protein